MAGSKKFKGKLCVYCRINSSTTADHVFPREFFQIEERSNLPKVPSCAQCNNEKSILEHYLTAVLPFAATHINAHKVLKNDAPKRLKNNKKLHSKLRDGMENIFTGNSESGMESRLGIDFDSDKLHEWVGFVGKGLMWHHWKCYLPVDAYSTVFTPSATGLDLLTNIFNLNSSLAVNVELGDGTIRYKGIMSEVDKEISIWTVQILGGITVIDSDRINIFNNSFVAMITGSKDIITDLEQDIQT